MICQTLFQCIIKQFTSCYRRWNFIKRQTFSFTQWTTQHWSQQWHHVIALVVYVGSSKEMRLSITITFIKIHIILTVFLLFFFCKIRTLSNPYLKFWKHSQIQCSDQVSSGDEVMTSVFSFEDPVHRLFVFTKSPTPRPLSPTSFSWPTQAHCVLCFMFRVA